jgi:uncharacterized membrane protein
MQAFVFLLVLTAAFSHALWNFFSKKTGGDFKLFWFGLTSVNILLIPFSVYFIFKTGFNINYLPYMIISITAHCLYYYTLHYSYKNGEISTNYPIARGIGVAGTAFISLIFLNETVSKNGGIAITAIYTGVLFFGLNRFIEKKFNTKSYYFAVLSGCLIFTYSISDYLGVKDLHPVVYINIIDLFCMIFLAPYAFHGGFKKSLEHFRNYFRESMIIGFMSAGTYLLILFAFTQEKASYIVALREFSVVIVSIIGFKILREKLNFFNITGIILITLGLFLIKIG